MWRRLARVLVRPHVGIPLAIALILVALPFTYRASRLSSLPPTSGLIDAHADLPAPIPDSENAYVEYRAAVTAMVSCGLLKVDEAARLGWERCGAEYRDCVKINTVALDTWKMGTEKEKALYFHPAEVGLDTQLIVVEKTRGIVWLAWLRGRKAEAEGDMNDAWSWHHAIHRCSRHLAQHGGFVERQVGVVVHGVACEAMLNCASLAESDSQHIRRAITSAATTYNLTRPRSVTIRNTYLSLENSLQRGYTHASWYGRGLSPLVRELLQSGDGGAFLLGEPEFSIGVTRLAFANWLAHIDRDLSERPPIHPGPLGLFEDSVTLDTGRKIRPDVIQRLWNDCACSAFIGFISHFDRTVLAEEARQALLLTGLAVQLYYREHNAIPSGPEDFERLLPEGLPQDPWSPTAAPIQFRRTGDTVIIWSLGENQVDHGGRFAIQGDRDEPDIGYEITFPKP